MGDQGKRLIIAVGLALVVMLVFNQFAHKDEPPPNAQTAGSGAGSGVLAPTIANTPALPSIGAAATAATPEAPARAPEQTIELKHGNVIATFSSYCGGLKTWQLTDPRYEHDATHGAMLPVAKYMTKAGTDGKPVPMPAAEAAKAPDCGAFAVNFEAHSTYTLPKDAVWTGTQVSPTEVKYTYANDQVSVTKAFTLLPDKYLVRMALSYQVHGAARQQLAVIASEFQDPSAVGESSARVAARAWVSSTLRGDSDKIVNTEVKDVIDPKTGWPRFEPSVTWTGFEHPYLLVAYAPHVREGIHVEKHTFAGEPYGVMTTALMYPATSLQANDTVTEEVVGYLGPKNYDNLTEADAAAGFVTGFKQTVDLGWFGFIGRPLLWLLQKFYAAVGNWGIAIILLTFLVKAATLYWTTKSMRSMKQMAALAPQMKALQAKYGDDKQRVQTETMALYKTHGVNPVAGCLPIFLQMPVWLALYRMLQNAGELYQQPFIRGWIDDLTAVDPLHILPIALVIVMFVQSRLQPATGDSRQQKLMQYGLPLMFGFASFWFPAGLTIYMFTNTVLSALHSIYMNKFDKKSLAIAAQLKANQEAVKLAEAKATEAKSGGKPKNGTNGKPKAAKPVIDVEATDLAKDDSPDDDAPSVGAEGAPRGNGNRPRRKKRRK